MRYESLALDIADPDYTYTTEDEMEFISGIGSWGEKKRDKKTLLENYLIGAYRRNYWCEIDADACMKHAYSEWKKYS